MHEECTQKGFFFLKKNLISFRNIYKVILGFRLLLLSSRVHSHMCLHCKHTSTTMECNRDGPFHNGSVHKVKTKSK